MKPFLIALSLCLLAISAAIYTLLFTNAASILKSPQVEVLSSTFDNLINTTPMKAELNRRASNCSEEMRVEFVKKARSINGAFKDNYYLAIGTSKIALSPVVLEMQKLKREMEDLDTDDCSKPAHDALVDAYNSAIDVFLDFMQERPNTIDPKDTLRDATTQLEAYAIDIAGAILISDFLIADKTDKNMELAPEIAYLEPIRSMKSKDDCEKIRDTLTVAMTAMGAGWRIYPLIDGFDADNLDVDKIDVCGKFTEGDTK